MDFTKKSALNYLKYLIYAYLAVFPLGVLGKIPVKGAINVNITDLIVVITIICAILFKINVFNLSIFKHFIIYLIFSFFISIFAFNLYGYFGFLYLLRIIAYLLFIEVNFFLIKKRIIKINELVIILLIVSVFTAILGWYQYLKFPDLRVLKYLGWDDHFGRMSGTFLDPGFFGIIMTFAALLSIVVYFNGKKRIFFVLSLLFVISTLLTFSRAAYFALIISSVYLIKNRISTQLVVLIIAMFFLIMPILPRFSSEGTELLRTSTVLARFDSYQKSLTVIEDSPLFGVGYNNLCEYKIDRSFEKSYASHSCSGFDSSLLLLIATGGGAGLIFFIDSLKNFADKTAGGDYSRLLKSSFLALLVHSLFTNSLFYPWVMGWFAIIGPLALNLREK